MFDLLLYYIHNAFKLTKFPVIISRKRYWKIIKKKKRIKINILILLHFIILCLFLLLPLIHHVLFLLIFFPFLLFFSATASTHFLILILPQSPLPLSISFLPSFLYLFFSSSPCLHLLFSFFIFPFTSW